MVTVVGSVFGVTLFFLGAKTKTVCFFNCIFFMIFSFKVPHHKFVMQIFYTNGLIPYTKW